MHFYMKIAGWLRSSLVVHVNFLIFSTEIILYKDTLSLLFISSLTSESQGNTEYLGACLCT